MAGLRAHNLLTFKVDVSVWDELIALIAMRGGLAALYIHRSVTPFVQSTSCLSQYLPTRQALEPKKSVGLSMADFLCFQQFGVPRKTSIDIGFLFGKSVMTALITVG